jgi:cyclopropane fatty-acyl-phospholipid synthase-like methyltransferase
MDEMMKIDNEIINLVPKSARILEVGCGDGRLAESLMTKRHDITSYLGIDLVEESVRDAIKKNIRDTKFARENYWDVLSADGDWDFVISEGVLFSCTNSKYKGLLMDLLDNTAERGYIVLSVVTMKPRVAMMEKSLENSAGIVEYYLRGPNRKRFNFPERLYNHPFWIIRKGIKNKRIPEVPLELKGLPEDNCLFNTIFYD